jgi:hypothetical protein
MLNLLPAVAATVTWIGPQDGDWNSSANWSTGALPGPNDDVVVDSTPAPTIRHTGSDTRILSLSLTGTLHLGGGSPTVLQPSQIQGKLVVEPDAAFVAEGASATLDVTGQGQISGGSLIASGGAQINPPGAMHRTTTGLIRAEGVGSGIHLNDLGPWLDRHPASRSAESGRAYFT